MIRIFTVSILLVSIVIISSIVRAENGERHLDTIALQPELLALLQAEMREINTGVQRVPVAISQGDWATLAQTGESIRSSYILAGALTDEQKQTLKNSLPARFKQLDSAFHNRAGKLAHAAESQDIELVIYHYSRLIEGCAQCHSLYARNKFPGFTPPEKHGHQH